MLDTAIQDFLSERKTARIKGKLTGNTSDEEKSKIEKDAEQEFLLVNWLPNAARRASQLSLTSHPGKFSHPDAKVSPILASAFRSPDGFVRTGNVDAEIDVLGNAAAMDVYKFLSLRLDDGKTILEHLDQNTDTIKKQLDIPLSPFSDIRTGLLDIKEDSSFVKKTSALVKQVYFPVNDGYHLLSLLTPSGLVTKLNERINAMLFSDQAKTARIAKRNQMPSEHGFDELYEMTKIGFGGTKPQNISVLNSKNGGTAYLLPSMPPKHSYRAVTPPISDFFRNTLSVDTYKSRLTRFHQILVDSRNNKVIRFERDEIIASVVIQVIERGLSVRQKKPGWSNIEPHTQIPRYQKLWLDETYVDERQADDQWLSQVVNEMAKWFVFAYEQTAGKDALEFQEEELAHIRSIIIENQEGIR